MHVRDVRICFALLWECVNGDVEGDLWEAAARLYPPPATAPTARLHLHKLWLLLEFSCGRSVSIVVLGGYNR